MTKTTAAVLSLGLFLAACSIESTPSGGSPPSNGTEAPSSDADGGTMSSPPNEGSEPKDELGCASYAFCSGDRVARYNGQRAPAMRGGTLKNGLYRLAYVLSTEGTGVQAGYAAIDGLLVRDARFRWVGWNGNIAGNLVTEEGGEIAFTPTAACDDRSGTTRDDAPLPRGFRHSYYADEEGRLFLFDFAGSLTYVFSSVGSLCSTADRTPATPGDSAECRSLNCGCTEAKDGPADLGTCKFVSGH